MSTDYDFDYIELDDEAEEYAAGWDALCAQLSQDEEWARYLYETTQTQEA
mgnify:CR=1 FL=1